MDVSIALAVFPVIFIGELPDKTMFLLIFIAEWGDLTQILTANLAARYHDALSVGVGATLALWAVAGVAVAGGQTLLRVVDVRKVRRATAVVLLALAVVSAYGAI